MAGDKRLSARFGADTTDFKAGITAINREIRVLESGFKASAAGLGDWTKSADGLELRAKSLTEQIGLQQEKVDALTLEYQQLAAAQGEDSAAAQNALINLNKQNEALGKMTSELNTTESALAGMQGGSEDASQAVDDLGSSSEDAGGKLGGFQGAMDKLGPALKTGAALVAGLAGAVAGLGAGITAMVMKTTEAAGDLVDLSTKTGISTTRLQELDYVAKQVGTSTETITGSLAKLTRSMGDAAAKTDGPAAEAFRNLGVAVVDSQGNLRDSEAVFNDALTALGGMTNETERDVAAMALFGKSAQELNPLIKTGADEIARLSKEANDMGAVMGEDDVAAAESFGDTLSSIQSGLQGTVGTLTGAFMPGFQQLATQGQGYVKQFGNVVKNADGDVGKMSAGIGELVGQVVGDMAKQAPQMLQAGLGIIQGIITSVITLLPTLMPMVVELINTLVTFIATNLPMILEAAVQIIVTLATGIADALPTLIPTIVGIIPKLVLVLLENLPVLIDAALRIILALASGLIAAIPVLIPEIPKILTAIFDAVIVSLPIIGEAAGELIGALVTGIAANLPLIITSASEMVTSWTNGITGLMVSIVATGVAIVAGVWEGIQSQAETFTKNITGFFTGIVDTVKKTLGIKSPSTVFAGIGENMALGLGGGFVQAFDGIERKINGAVGGLSGGLSLAGMAGSGGGSSQINLGGVHVTVAQGDALSVSQAARRGARMGLVDALRARGEA